MDVERGLGRLLLDLGRLDGLLGVVDLLLGDLVPRRERPEPIGGARACSTATLACSTASSLARRSSGRGSDLSRASDGLQPVAGRRLLRQVGLRDGLVELDDRLALLHRAALLDEQFVDVPLDGGRQRGDVVGQGLARPSPRRLRRGHPVSPLGANRDVGFLFFFSEGF